MQNLDPRRARWIRVRLVLLVILLGVGFTRLVGAAFDLQVRRRDELGDRAEQQYTRHVEIAPRRGTIYDRHHNALAVSVAASSLAANPRRLAAQRIDVPALAARLASALALPPADVAARLAERRGFVWIKRFLTPQEVTDVREIMAATRVRNRDGLDLVEESRRWYPNRELAAHVLGFVGSDGRGLEGLEKSLDENLRGRSVSVQGLRDARGNLVFAEGLAASQGQAGDDVTVTIDSTIQFIVERELALTCQAAEARGGTVIVTDPRSGEVLAMANWPTFNPNAPRASDPESVDARRNRAITDRFEPGSTMKIFSIAGALDAAVVQPGQLINCYGGTYTVGDLTIHDAHPDTWLTPMQVMARSSNIGAAQIGAALGSEGLERTYRRFGFGERTGLPLPGEARARFGERRWYEVEVATVAFGQGIGVTAIQLAQALGAVANGGRLLRPALVSRITDATGALVEERAPDPGRPALQPGVARLTGEFLTAVTEEGGTGVEAAIPGVRVAGKTGTAQKANEHGRGYDDDRWVSSFIGYAPANGPRLVVTVIIDEPQLTHAGGAVAAPLFRRVTEQSLRYLGVLPSGRAPIARGNRATARERAATRDVGPEGATSRRAPANAPTPGAVPDVTGRSAAGAVSALHAAGFDADLVGSGLVARQSPAAGTAPAAASSLGARRVRVWLEPGGGAPALAPEAPPVEDGAR